MKFYKYAVAIACLGLSLNAIGINKSTSSNDYNSGAYADEGKILVKFRGFFASTKGSHKNLPATTSGSTPSVNLLTNGYGLENANTVFFTDHLATELSLGITAYNVSRSSLAKIADNYSNTSNSNAKKRLLIGLPLSLTMQFHVAPFGAIRPYIGGGYSWTYFFSKAAEFKVKSGHGLVFQAGVDITMTDDSLINLDVRKYSLAPKITYKSGFLGGNTPVSSKLQINPWTISLGVGFKL